MSNIRTSLQTPTEPWERARSRFLEGLTEEEQANFRSATLETIYYQADVAHRDHQEKSKLQACRQKLRPLLDILEAYGKGLDVISNTGTASMVMAPLWGSIRVALQIAQDSTETFEKIVDMLKEIGEALPHFRDYEQLFSSHERLLVAISDAYLIVIYFCTDIKELFGAAKKTKRSKISLRLACQTSWIPFKKKFDQYLRDFTQLQSRIDKEAQKADMIEAKQERKRQEDHRMALVRFNKKEKLTEALLRISPYDYKAHHRRIQEMRHHGTATWLFDCQPFQEWLSTPTSSSFGCFGIPGSGKTILASSVNDHLVSTQQSSVLYYHYCSYEYPSSLKTTAILGTFLRQMLERAGHSAAVEESLYEDLQDKLDVPIPRELFSVISNYFKSGNKYFFLIDGVDELPHPEQTELAAVLQKALTVVSGCTVKIFLSCRPEAVIHKKVFRPAHSVTISPEDLSRDIRSFVEAVIDEKLKEGELELRDPRLKYEIIDRLATGAKEMFLWVKFQIDEICEAVSDEGIRETLEKLPRDLVSTYARIIHRIESSRGGPAKLEIIGKVFRWLNKSDVLYRAIAVSSSSTAKQFLDLLEKHEMQVALGQPKLEKEGVFFRRTKLERNHSWLESTWFQKDLTQNGRAVFDALIARSSSQGDDEVSEKIRTSILHNHILRVEIRFFSVSSHCKLLLDGEIVREVKRPSISQSFDLQVHDKTTAEFRADGYEVVNDGRDVVCVDRTTFNLADLQPFKQKLMTVRTDGESGAVLINLKLMWMRKDEVME
ncbi:hypothetical protein SLS55_005099 [Diplodia seriata]|uniref:NACHT domain-containing protein n=1 Tax=Diplodia seriata TaxID=420778 RepID=A0ABR3CFF2_9PEZI